MLKWAVIFGIVSLIAGALGFSNISSGAGKIAKVLFGIFLLFFLVVVILSVLGIAAL